MPPGIRSMPGWAAEWRLDPEWTWGNWKARLYQQSAGSSGKEDTHMSLLDVKRGRCVWFCRLSCASRRCQGITGLGCAKEQQTESIQIHESLLILLAELMYKSEGSRFLALRKITRQLEKADSRNSRPQCGQSYRASVNHACTKGGLKGREGGTGSSSPKLFNLWGEYGDTECFTF